MSQKIKIFIEKFKKIHPAITFAVFGLSFFLGDFFLLRADAYTSAVIAPEFVQTLDTVGVYVYMFISAYLNATFVFFACRMILSFTAFKYAIKFDKTSAALYLELFAIAANLIAAIFVIFYIKFPFIFVNYAVIIKFIIMTVGYALFAYYYIKEYMPGRYAAKVFVGLAYPYFAVNIIYTIFMFISGGAVV